MEWGPWGQTGSSALEVTPWNVAAAVLDFVVTSRLSSANEDFCCSVTCILRRVHLEPHHASAARAFSHTLKGELWHKRSTNYQLFARALPSVRGGTNEHAPACWPRPSASSSGQTVALQPRGRAVFQWIRSRTMRVSQQNGTERLSSPSKP